MFFFVGLPWKRKVIFESDCSCLLALRERRAVQTGTIGRKTERERERERERREGERERKRERENSPEGTAASHASPPNKNNIPGKSGIGTERPN